MVDDERARILSQILFVIQFYEKGLDYSSKK